MHLAVFPLSVCVVWAKSLDYWHGRTGFLRWPRIIITINWFARMLCVINTSSSYPVIFLCVDSSLTVLLLLFLSLCLSKTLAKGVEHLVHYFRDTAWYSTACLFPSVPVCMVSDSVLYKQLYSIQLFINVFISRTFLRSSLHLSLSFFHD